ncbi:MAG: hypothetical protein K2P81_06660 [Bacteriovoracaceae bacterium]|nr:hypothetical protein [Bacteriovoracaceae bacterium]
MTKKMIILTSFAATLAVALLYVFNFWNVAVADTYIMRDSIRIPGSNTFAYWLDVFSHQNHGPQYRPVGFFTYFWLMGYFFNASLWSLAMVSYGLLFWSFIELGKLFKRFQWGSKAFVTSLVVMVFHPVMGNILDQSFAIKYQFTLAVFLMGLNLFTQTNSKSKWIFFLFLSLLCGLSQEGTIVFPFIWLVWDFYWNKKLKWPHCVLFSYVAIYLIARTIFFDVPRAGFMEVSWKHLPVGLSYYLHKIFSSPFGIYDYGANYNGSFQGVWLSSIVIILGVSVFALYKKQWVPLLFLGFTFCLVAPYSVLINHIGYDRGYWGLACIGVIAAWVVQYSKRWSLLIMILFLGGSLISLKSHWPNNVSYMNLMANIPMKAQDFIKKINPAKDEFVLIKLTSNDLEDEWLNFMLFAGEIAHQDPSVHLILEFYDGRGFNLDYRHYVRDGVKYRIRKIFPERKTVYTLDQFQHTQLLELPKPLVDRELSMSMPFPKKEAHPWVQQ